MTLRRERQVTTHELRMRRGRSNAVTTSRRPRVGHGEFMHGEAPFFFWFQGCFGDAGGHELKPGTPLAGFQSNSR